MERKGGAKKSPSATTSWALLVYLGGVSHVQAVFGALAPRQKGQPVQVRPASVEFRAVAL